AHHPRARGAAVPRFDRRGFPMDPKDRAARRDRLRARAVTTTVVATVVAAPVLALWAAYRGSSADEGGDGPAATAQEAHDHGGRHDDTTGDYENTGNAGIKPGARFLKDGAAPDVSVEVISVAGTGKKDAGHLEVSARTSGETTFVTLTASGPSPVHWSASTPAGWLYLSRASGTLRPGESLTIRVYVDPLREPSGFWTARVAVAPAGAVVSIRGYGTASSHPSDPDGRPTAGTPDPTPPTSAPTDPPTSASPTPTDPTPTPTAPSPSDPPSSTPTPTDAPTPSPSDS
ncbi:BACON domain-containing protein, partial [Streptomyces sp. NPDC004752]